MNNITSFKEFLKKGLETKKYHESPEADFANDVMADKKFRDFKNWEDLETYIIFRGACREAIKAARTCFKQWKASNESN